MSDASEMVLASRRRLVGAYDAWLAVKGRAERKGELTPRKHSNRLFVDELRRLMELSRDELPLSFKIPTTRSGWSNWRSGRAAENIKLRLDVCRAIHVLTNVDVTSNQFLSDRPVNATDLVTIGSAVGTESRDGEVTVFVSFVDFRTSEAQNVFLSDVRSIGSARTSQNALGSVRFGLKQASLYAKVDSDLEPMATHIGDGSVSQNGLALGAELSLDDEGPLRWRVQPPFPKEALHARLENIHLCKGKPTFDGSAFVAVSIQNADVTPSINFDSRVEIIDQEYRDTKKRLVERLIKGRYLDGGPRNRYILSQSRIKWK